MKRYLLCAALLLMALPGSAVESSVSGATGTSKPAVREITIVQDNANIRFVSKFYQLKNVKAAELLPYVNSAIKRYNVNSTVRRVFGGAAGSGEALLVTTGTRFMPCVDALIEQLDIPASGIVGTGMARIAYTPRFRAARSFSTIIDQFLGTEQGLSGVDMATNTIFWRDDSVSAQNTLSWMERLDRPLPQVRIRFNYYELRESTLRDVGFDYLAWKNGPGVNLFAAGYSAGELVLNEAVVQTLADTASWGFGGFFFAPAFDMSFIRCLQQSGEASVAANGSLTMVNTPIESLDAFRKIIRKQRKNPDTAPYQYRLTLEPEYQNIQKNSQGRSFIGASFDEDEEGELYKNPPVLEMKIINPLICFPRKANSADKDGFLPVGAKIDNKELADNGGVIFHYQFNFKNVVERGNTGEELSHYSASTGSTTLGFNVEKIVSVYDKESEVEQTIGLPILSKLPVLKYLFSTTTVVKEHTYVIVTAEAELVNPGDAGAKPVGRSEGVHERKQKDLGED